MVVGGRRTGLSSLRSAMLLRFSCSTVSYVCINNGPPCKGHPANLTQLWEALESTVERFRHLVEFMPQRNEAVLRAKEGTTQY